MKVYVRKWTATGMYEVVKTIEIDSYNGLTFTNYKENVTRESDVLGRVQCIYLHAGEPNALVVYVEEVKP